MTEGSSDPFAHIPEGRFTWGAPAPAPVVAPRRRSTLDRTALAAMVLLGVAAGAAAWTATCFATRGPDDVEVTTSKALLGSTPIFEGTTYWSTDFLVRAYLPWTVAFLCCGAAFVWWHLTVDRAARDLGEEPTSAGWQVRWGWFIPFANLAYPFRSMRDLTQLYSARTAERLVVPWWSLWVLSFGISAWVWYAAPGEGVDYSGDSAERLGTMDNALVVAWVLTTIDAVLAILLVRSLTQAVRERLTSLSGQ